MRWKDLREGRADAEWQMVTVLEMMTKVTLIMSTIAAICCAIFCAKIFIVSESFNAYNPINEARLSTQLHYQGSWGTKGVRKLSKVTHLAPNSNKNSERQSPELKLLSIFYIELDLLNAWSATWISVVLAIYSFSFQFFHCRSAG